MSSSKPPKTKPRFESFKDQRDLYAPTKVFRRKVVFEQSESVPRADADQLDVVARVSFPKKLLAEMMPRKRDSK